MQPTARLGGPSLLANPQPIQIFYLTLPEDQVQTALKAIYSGVGANTTSVTGIALTADGTIVYYDQWEDGYELDIANPIQASTLIVGDGNTGNGNACLVAQPASLCVKTFSAPAPCWSCATMCLSPCLRPPLLL